VNFALTGIGSLQDFYIFIILYKIIINK